MINKLQIPSEVSKKEIGKHRTGELRLKTKKQVNTLTKYTEGKRGRRKSNEIIELIPQLSYNEFIDFLEKEIDKQNFNNKNIEFYEILLNRLEELKVKINDKIKYRYFNDKIEQALLESSKKNGFNYLDEKIKENDKYNKISTILNAKHIKTTLLSKNNKESYLSITVLDNKNEINDNLDDLLELLYQGKLESSLHLMKVTNRKLIEIYSKNSDIEKYLKGKQRGIGATEKVDKIYDTLDYDTAVLLAIKNFKNGDIKKLKKIKDYLNSKKGNPENNVDTKLLRAIKIEIELLTQKDNNKKRIDEIINILENNNQKSILIASISEIKHIMETKKESDSLNYFNFLLLGASKKSRNTDKNYSKITQLKKIKKNLESVKGINKTRDYLISAIKNKLNELEK